MAPGANIYGVKVLDDKGSGTYVSVLAGLDEILHIREKAPEKAMVVSMSLAGPCDLNICDKDPLILAMEELSKSRVTTIVAAGNSYRDACTITPAASPYVLTIGASTINDNNAPFSNWGSCVDLFAPGDSIVSACSSASSECSRSIDSYSTKSGTSMATPHVAGVTALWLTQTVVAQAELREVPTFDEIKRALQCTSSQNNLRINSELIGPNLMLQVPPPDYEEFHSISCDLDFGCDQVIVEGVNVSCSGNGECVAGICLCDSGASGTNCSNVQPWWEYESFCCDGQSLESIDETGPFNTIAFLWTDLNPSLGAVYHGVVADGEAFIVVFDKVPFYEGLCSTTVEVVIHASNKVEIIFVYNELGNICFSNNISIGIKGGLSEFATTVEFEQLYGPSVTAPEHLHVTFAPLFTDSVNKTEIPSLAPTAMVTGVPTPSPTPRGLTSYNVTRLGAGKSFIHGDYSGLTSLNISVDGYITVSLPYFFNFFGSRFDTLYISENGMISFSIPSVPCCDGLDIQSADNTVAVLWTDLALGLSGNVFFGAIQGNQSVVVVFNDIHPDGYFCTSTVEIQLHKSGVIEVAYLSNAVGYSCGSRDVSAGIVSTGGAELFQLYGPAPRGFPFSETIVYTPTFNASAILVQKSSSEELDPGSISGIVVAVVVCLIAAAVCLFYFLKRRSMRWKHDLIQDREDDEIVFSMNLESQAPLALRTVPVKSQEQDAYEIDHFRL